MVGLQWVDVNARPLEAHLDCSVRGITAVDKRGYAWSVIVFGMVVPVRWDLHECQDPRFPSRDCVAMRLSMLLIFSLPL